MKTFHGKDGITITTRDIEIQVEALCLDGLTPAETVDQLLSDARSCGVRSGEFAMALNAEVSKHTIWVDGVSTWRNSELVAYGTPYGAHGEVIKSVEELQPGQEAWTRDGSRRWICGPEGVSEVEV